MIATMLHPWVLSTYSSAIEEMPRNCPEQAPGAGVWQTRCLPLKWILMSSRLREVAGGAGVTHSPQQPRKVACRLRAMPRLCPWLTTSKAAYAGDAELLPLPQWQKTVLLRILLCSSAASAAGKSLQR